MSITVDQLQFQEHANWEGATAAKVFFPNGYGASVITGGHSSYTSPGSPYELAVLRGDADDCTLDYNTPITDDVLGWLTAEGVNEALVQIAELPAIKEPQPARKDETPAGAGGRAI